MGRRIELVQHHSRVALLVHVVWATARREPVLSVEADDWLRGVLIRKARQGGCELVACGNAADHVHALVRDPSTVTVASFMQLFKGYSSYAWNTANTGRRLAWQAGYWAESVAPNSLAKVAAYVAGQRDHHLQTLLAPEPWELGEADDFRDDGDTVGLART